MSRQRKNRNRASQKKPALSKSENAVSNVKPFHWRDHPVVVAAFSAVGTFTFTAFAFKEIIIPTQVADINNKIRDLPNLEASIQSLTKSNSDHVQTIDGLKRQIETLQQRSLFKPSDPFPVILDKVKLGQPVSDVEKYFASAKIEKNDEVGFWSVDLGYGAVPQATYYFDEKSEGKEISHILYWVSDSMKLTDHFIHDRLVEALGVPSKSPRKDYYEWHLKQYKVYQRDSRTYVIMDANTRPGYWPD